MSLKFTTTKLASAQEAYSLQKLELLNATEALNSAWMDLTDAQREIDGLQEIMDNVHQSVEMLTKFGVDAIPMLNTDGGLEALLQIPERLITVEKAMEAMDEQKKSMWQKFKDIITRIVKWIKDLILRLNPFNKSIEAKLSRLRKQFSKFDPNVAPKYSGRIIKFDSLIGIYDRIALMSELNKRMFEFTKRAFERPEENSSDILAKVVSPWMYANKDKFDTSYNFVHTADNDIAAFQGEYFDINERNVEFGEVGATWKDLGYTDASKLEELQNKILKLNGILNDVNTTTSNYDNGSIFERYKRDPSETGKDSKQTLGSMVRSMLSIASKLAQLMATFDKYTNFVADKLGLDENLGASDDE